MPKPKPPKPEIESIDDERVVINLLSELQATLKVLAARRATLSEGGFDPELAAATAAIARAALTAVAERRQREKARRREVALIPLEELIEHLRTLPEKKRDSVVHALTSSRADMANTPIFP